MNANHASVNANVVSGRLVALTLSIAWGCAGCGWDSLPTYPVRGKVTFNGVPVVEGSVLFTSDDPSLPFARGRLQPDGSYELATRDAAGAAAGEYKVTIRAFDSEGQTIDTKFTPPKPLVPIEYTNLRTTPLVRTVEPQELNIIDIEL